MKRFIAIPLIFVLFFSVGCTTTQKMKNVWAVGSETLTTTLDAAIYAKENDKISQEDFNTVVKIGIIADATLDSMERAIELSDKIQFDAAKERFDKHIVDMEGKITE